ncbi:peptidoglycan DD-metalloendopeptidase family protein [Massilia glaciei]|uniref:LysM peptidoglycan-binding domain-containing protein n=1 Tax=Massilia glaciei TaxID=1524097 RepID=A0A2U2HPG5_9BURK|nr:peptidoglycan DD-metalloendopeptidase family protein [Massilia glaciei]PWF49316.1 LysM peptidoglycan-binding domain-containing protein [Massilia glaciei]
MKQKSHLFLLTISCALLGACTSALRQAPVVERGVRPAAAATAAAASAPRQSDDPHLYTVKKGDTLLRIALDFGQNYRDIVSWNSLADPDDILVDQVLRVGPPEKAAAQGAQAAQPAQGVQTMAVSMPPAEARAPAPPKKTMPRADKRIYTDGALAEMQRSEGGARAPEPARALAPPVAAPAAPQVAAPAPAAEAEKLSWMWPSEGRVVAAFDEGKNKGIDIAGRAGQQVLAAGAGKVMYAGSGIRGYGNLVIVKHSNSLLSAYAHNRSIMVKEGQSVTKGEKIAEMGDSDADSVKLHFEIRQQGKPVDPSRFLPNR